MENNLGGPVWHASVAWQDLAGPRPIVLMIPAQIIRLSYAARKALDGVGDARLGEWSETGERAIHLLRRLTASEWGDRPWGMDYRHCAEGERRLAPVRHLLPGGWVG